MPKNAVCAEIGVFQGSFSRRILQTTKPSRLHLIDPWLYYSDERYKNTSYGGSKGIDQSHLDKRYESVVNSFQSEILANRVVIHKKKSEDAVTEFPDSYFDWIYLDGDHRYENIMKDLRLYTSKIKIGGYITGDDYAHDGWWDNDVEKAVDEFVALGTVDLLEIRNRQFILRRRS